MSFCCPDRIGISFERYIIVILGCRCFNDRVATYWRSAVVFVFIDKHKGINQRLQDCTWAALDIYLQKGRCILDGCVVYIPEALFDHASIMLPGFVGGWWWPPADLQLTNTGC